MDLSVIIINWNTKALLGQCLSVLPAACQGLNYEVFVVDNGSSDGSQDMVREEYPATHLIENEMNRGFAAANNQAIIRASGRYYLLLNSDTKAMPESFTQMVAYLDADESIGIAGPQLLNEDGSRQYSIAATPSLFLELTRKSIVRRIWPRKYYGYRFQPQTPVDVDSVIGASLMIRATTVDEIGMLDESFFFFLEETDWCFEARQKGWRVIFMPKVEVYHFQGKTAELVPCAVRVEYWRSRYTYFRKHGNLLTCLILRVGLIAHLIVNFLYYLLASLLDKGARKRLKLNARMLAWHCMFCPSSWGLSARTNSDKS